ncbi:uncharacterized protein LOC119659253 isoform X2 [Hermetia illucens]|uniref:uncharacterized protein LOC119659253 isoform X2 n=1 Tax=Hermetia illucens TaxID=343691 RepID=UPI0018CC2B3C|nr:uncharacterized protein LOC119659253 isoform X2 [Hermetia illucens]
MMWTFLSLARKECMRGELLSMRHEQIGGYVNIFSTFLNETFAEGKIDLFQTLVNPTLGIELTRWGLVESSTNLFNSSILICEIERMSRVNLFTKVFGEVVKKMTNFTLTCPLPAGVYFVRLGVDDLKRIFPLRLLYRENTFLTALAQFYEQKQKGDYTLFGQALFNFQIKRYC